MRGFEALKAASDAKDKAAVAKSLASLKCTTMVGALDFTSGPVPNVSVTPEIGGQWVRAADGSKFKYDFVVCDNANDPNVPVAAKLRAYNS